MKLLETVCAYGAVLQQHVFVYSGIGKGKIRKLEEPPVKSNYAQLFTRFLNYKGTDEVESRRLNYTIRTSDRSLIILRVQGAL